jgi:hypothetical protein
MSLRWPIAADEVTAQNAYNSSDVCLESGCKLADDDQEHSIDAQERYTAREIERSHPQWMVMWGCYTRLFWAFPRFRVPSGTIVSARGDKGLLTDMREVEIEFGARPRLAGYDARAAAPLPARPAAAPLPARPAPAELPRRSALAIRNAMTQWGAPVVPAARRPVAAAPPAEPDPRRRDYDPYISGPLGPYDFGPDDSGWDLRGSFWADGEPTQGRSDW